MSRDATLLSFADFVLDNRRSVVASALALLVLVLSIVLLEPRTYTSRTSFVAQGSVPVGGNVVGLAAQLGLGAGAGAASESPAFYAELLRSREVMREVVGEEYTLVDGRKGLLPDLIDVKKGDSVWRVNQAMRWLDGATKATVSDRTGVVQLQVHAPDPRLAAQLGNALLGELSRFNLDRRRSRGAAERQFADKRLSEAQADLHAAEERQRAFLEHNRQYASSPELQLRFERLSADVARSSQIRGTLAQMFEQARLEEIRDTPVITVLDKPEVPTAPDGRGVALRAILSLIGGGALGIAFATLRKFVQRLRALRLSATSAETIGRQAEMNDQLGNSGDELSADYLQVRDASPGAFSEPTRPV